MEVNLDKVIFDTGNGKKSLAKCTDDEFRIFLCQNDIDIIESSDEWSLAQREMVLGMIVYTAEQLAALNNIEISEESEDDKVDGTEKLD